MRQCRRCGAGTGDEEGRCPTCGEPLDGTSTGPPAPPVLLGVYALVGVIGSGATSTVYLATDTRSGGQVALKVLDPVLCGFAGYPERIRSESAVLAQLADCLLYTSPSPRD